VVLLEARVAAVRWAALAALCLPAAAFAWGPEGHMAVGAIADARLAGTPTAAKMKAILHTGETLQTVAVWADCAKGVRVQDGQFVYASDDAQFPECKPFAANAAEFVHYVSANWTQCGLPHGHEYCHQQYHYADVAIQRDRYQQGFAGTSGHDVVQAINACIAMLQGRPVPAPFVFADKREALMLLAHYVGDIHQPLHVGAVYLDEHGKPVDPDAGAYDVLTETSGGNLLADHGGAFHPKANRPPPYAFHSEWDAIPASLAIGGALWSKLLIDSAAAPEPASDAITWSAQWATESVAQAKLAYTGLTFTSTGNPHNPSWDVAGADAAYKSKAEAIQAKQLARAGARLAWLLKRVL
jgi:hypothetical protein